MRYPWLFTRNADKQLTLSLFGGYDSRFGWYLERGKKFKEDQSRRSADNPETGASTTAIQSRPGKYHKCTLAGQVKEIRVFIHAVSFQWWILVILPFSSSTAFTFSLVFETYFVHFFFFFFGTHNHSLISWSHATILACLRITLEFWDLYI
jgi:hypothetical protein